MNLGDDNNNSVIEKNVPIFIVTLKAAVAKYTTQDNSSLYLMGEPDVVKLVLQIQKKEFKPSTLMHNIFFYIELLSDHIECTINF